MHWIFKANQIPFRFSHNRTAVEEEGTGERSAKIEPLCQFLDETKIVVGEDAQSAKLDSNHLPMSCGLITYYMHNRLN